MIKRIAETTINGFWVSTVLLPNGYETMVFDRRTNANNWTDFACWRDKTETEAIARHVEAINFVINQK